MNRRAFLAAAVAAPAALVAAPRSPLAARVGGGAVALVTADLEAHLVAIDLSTGRVVERIRTEPGPRSIESSPFGTAVVAHTTRGRISIVDVATLTVRGVIADLGEPRYTAVHPADPLAYVTDSRGHEVVTIDLARRTIVGRTPVPGPARHLSLSPDGRVLWTALGTKADRVAILDLADARAPRVVRTITPPFLAHDVVFAPDGAHVWVTSGSRESIAVYRPRATGSPRMLAAGAPPQHVAFSGRRGYVASGDDGTVQVRRLDGSVVKTTAVPRGSYNVTYGSAETTFGQPTAVTPSLLRGTVCLLSPSGAVRAVKRVARSAHDACIVEAG